MDLSRKSRILSDILIAENNVFGSPARKNRDKISLEGRQQLKESAKIRSGNGSPVNRYTRKEQLNSEKKKKIRFISRTEIRFDAYLSID